MIVVTCDAPGCGISAVVRALTDHGRMTPPPGWWAQTGRNVTVTACCTDHFNAALKAGQQPLRAAEPEPGGTASTAELFYELGHPDPARGERAIEAILRRNRMKDGEP
jgi:hypothetical protein